MQFVALASIEFANLACESRQLGQQEDFQLPLLGDSGDSHSGLDQSGGNS